MNGLGALIRRTDDDYLIGLSNKGIVKRAYKDLEQETPVLTWQGEEAQVALREETCVLCAPLGESRCSCPSRSICRHVVTAILWMRRKLSEEPESGEENAGGRAPILLEEILSIPADRLKRACGSRSFRLFLAHMRAEELPPLEESSIVTVTLPWENAVVKLLEPFACSACSCHSRELCVHKAQAALAYQIKKGRISLEALERMQKTEETWDMEQAVRTGGNVRRALIRQLDTGLSRQSKEVTEELERLAVLSHRARLPELENGLRSLAGEYGRYFSRSAAFCEEALLRMLMQLYELAGRLKEAKTQEELGGLAGSFRETYEPAGRLHLVGMGGRTFSGRTGYEGEIYYFLEIQKKEWYTWTDARPVFYEGVRRRPPAGERQAQAPWGLNCSREQMQMLEFRLTNARAASGGRLSASQETKAEIVGARSLENEAVRGMIFWDYKELLRRYFSEKNADKNRSMGRREYPALVGAVRWEKTDFDTVQQRFSWCVRDIMGRRLFISMKYTKEEKLTIRLLERLEQRLRTGFQGALVFFGSLYLDEEDRMCLFPVEFFVEEAEMAGKSLKSSEPEDKECTDRPKRGGPPDEETVRTLAQYCREASGLLSDLLVTGLSSVQDDLLDRMTALTEEGESLGLHGAAGELSYMEELLRGKRHRMEFSPEQAARAMGRLNRYLLACRGKLSCDTALLSMEHTEEKKSIPQDGEERPPVQKG